MAAILSVKNLSFQYPSYPGLESTLLFKDLSFDLERGTMNLFLAMPGAGKTGNGLREERNFTGEIC